MATKTYCDRCGKLFRTGEKQFVASGAEKEATGGWCPSFKDLCERCLQQMFEPLPQPAPFYPTETK